MRVIIIICHWFQPLEDYQPGLERGRWAEPAVQKWVSCFHHSRPFPTTSTISTTACWHGELHLTRRAPSHTESSISPRRPADTESSISHGELHLTRKAPSHHDGLLTRRAPSHTESSISPRRPAHTESSISHGELHLTRRAPSHTESSISHGELHLTTTACWHGELHLTMKACWRPTAPQPHRYRHWPVLCVELPAARYAQKNNKKTHTPISRTTAFSRTSSVRLEWRTDWIDCGRSLFTPCSWLRRNKYKNKQTNKNKKSSVASAASSVTLRGLPKADHCGQRSQYRTRNSEAGCSIPSLASDCG